MYPFWVPFSGPKMGTQKAKAHYQPSLFVASFLGRKMDLILVPRFWRVVARSVAGAVRGGTGRLVLFGLSRPYARNLGGPSR